MLNKAYKTSLLPILRSTKSLPPASLTVPRLALVMAHAKAGVESYPSRRIHVEDISSQVPELPIRIFRITNDFESHLDLQLHSDMESVEGKKAAFEDYYSYSKEKFKQILQPDTVNIYVQATTIHERPSFSITPGHIAIFPTDEEAHIIEDGVISFRNDQNMVADKRLMFKLDNRPVKFNSVFNGLFYPFLKDSVIYNSAGESEPISEFRSFCKKALSSHRNELVSDLFQALNSSVIIQCNLADLVEPGVDVATTLSRLLEEIKHIKGSACQYYYLTDGWLITEAAYVALRKKSQELLESVDINIETTIAKIKEIDSSCVSEKVEASNCVTYVIALKKGKFKIEHLRPETATIDMIEQFLEKYFARLLNHGKIVQKLANILKPVPDDAPTP